MVDYLLPMAKIDDIKSYANQMFSAKSNLTGYSMEQILLLDYKTYVFNNQLWGIGVAETFYPNNIFERKDELIIAMNNEKKKSNLIGLLFSVIDIDKEQNLMIILGEPENTVVQKTFNVSVQKTFNVSVQNSIADLGARISRKKDIIPLLERYFSTNYPNGSQLNSPLRFVSLLLSFFFLLTQYI
jgi:manganese-dependent inorganic pyrophosphatase